MPITFGLASTPAVRWLIGSEKELYERIVHFYMGNANTDIVEVIGPPDEEDLRRTRERGGPNEAVPLPVVRLRLRLSENRLTGEKGVEALCSDSDLAEIERWARLALLKHKGTRQ